MKTFYRCSNFHYTFQKSTCPHCGEKVKHPYPARFSFVKENKFHKLRRSQNS